VSGRHSSTKQLLAGQNGAGAQSGAKVFVGQAAQPGSFQAFDKLRSLLA
jgi:hypothetical protein